MFSALGEVKVGGSQKKLIGFGFIVLMFLFSCSERNQLKRISWSQKSSVPLTVEQAQMVSALQKDQFQEVQLSDQKIQRWRMTSEGIPVEGTWLKVMRDNQNRLLKIEGEQTTETPNEKEKDEAKNLLTQKETLLNFVWKKNKTLQLAQNILPAQIIFIPMRSGFEPVIELVYFNHDGTDVQRLYINKQGRILSSESVVQSLTAGTAQVFPGFPNQTILTEVAFTDLIGDGTLTTPSIRVESANSPRVYSPTHNFLYQPEDKGFDEVQSFYYMDQLFDWLKNQYALILPFQLKIKLHVGGLTPSNAAFYYDGNINLGDGDNIVYKKIPLDPTIVSHEACHSLVQVLAGLPQGGEGGALNEAFADFISANFLEYPQMGGYSYLKAPYQRTLENDLNAVNDRNQGKYQNSLLVSGTLWQMRKILGKEKAGWLGLHTLAKLGPNSVLNDFPRAVNETIDELTVDQATKEVLKTILVKRGW